MKGGLGIGGFCVFWCQNGTSFQYDLFALYNCEAVQRAGIIVERCGLLFIMIGAKTLLPWHSRQYRSGRKTEKNGEVETEEHLTSLGVQCSFLTSFPSFNHPRIFSTVASSSFNFFISRLWPPRRVCFFRFSSAFSTNSISLIRNSSLMMLRSRIGSTSPSTWIISASSKHRTTWKIASTALI